MVRRLFLPAVIRISVKMQRQPRHCFRKNADAGVHRRHLHGGTLVYPFPARASAHEKAVGAPRCAVLRRIPRPEQTSQKSTAISVAASTTLLCRGDNATDKEVELVNAVFKPLGTVVELPESRLNAAIAVTSCGIAYVMRFVRATVEGAVELGLSPDQALGLCIDTLAGTSALLGKNGSHPEAEIDKVTTPGGLTIRGLNAMEEAGFSQSVIKGLRASLPSKD